MNITLLKLESCLSLICCQVKSMVCSGNRYLNPAFLNFQHSIPSEKNVPGTSWVEFFSPKSRVFQRKILQSFPHRPYIHCEKEEKYKEKHSNLFCALCSYIDFCFCFQKLKSVPNHWGFFLAHLKNSTRSFALSCWIWDFPFSFSILEKSLIRKKNQISGIHFLSWEYCT